MIDPVEFGKAIGAIVKEATAPLLRRIEELESRQMERGEPGPRGEPGQDAEPVLVSEVVAELVKSDLLAPVVDLYVEERVTKHFEANPIQHGRDGEPGPKGDNGNDGLTGKDGTGLADALIDNKGALVLTLTDGRTKELGVIVGRDGSKGADGKDGADFSNVEFDYDGERALTIRGKGGEIVKRLPIPIDRGYWSEGKSAEQGDVVTHDGTAFIALRETKAKPCKENAEDWRILARKGRDGLHGRNGIDKTAPVKVNANA